MRKERFPSKRKSKIMPRSEGPFEILEQISPNAYKGELPSDYGVSATFNVADLRPYLDENEAILSLRSNFTQPGEDNGDHLTAPLETLPSDPSPVMGSSTVKEVQMVVRNLLNNSDSKMASSTGNWPGFVCLVESSTEWVISCTHDLLQAYKVSFPTSPLACHLELICPLKQSKNRRYLFIGQNPAKGRSRAHLDSQINSNFCETLGHKNTLLNVCNPCPKVGFWMTFASISSRVKLLGGERATRMLAPLDTRLPTCHLPCQPTMKGRKNSPWLP